MNFIKFLDSAHLKENPLCGIGEYKDTLNLATGVVTRKIGKLVLTGKESWNNNFGQSLFGVQNLLDMAPFIAGITAYSTHFNYNPVQSGLDNAMSNGEFALQKSTTIFNVFFKNTDFTSTTDFKAWLAAQHSAGHPVTVWYVLATSKTGTITVPSGLSGIVEGSLTQTGTPTPTNPIYPTANDAEGWYDILHYKRGTSTDTLTLPAVIYGDGTAATLSLKGNTEHTGTPTPQNPVMPQGTGDLETSGEHAGQYKIPISSAGQTTLVYLGEVQSTRRIKKLVFNGLEAWSYVGGQVPFQYLPSNFGMLSQDVTFYICSHYKAIPYNASWTANDKFVSASAQGLRFKDTTFGSLDDFKAYLAQQYTNGTPVCVWYVLSTPTTGIVNEPLMKIGSYADSLTTSIPTTDGANSLSVGTTVQPSEVSAAYHGWHPVAAAHEAENGQWD